MADYWADYPLPGNAGVSDSKTFRPLHLALETDHEAPPPEFLVPNSYVAAPIATCQLRQSCIALKSPESEGTSPLEFR